MSYISQDSHQFVISIFFKEISVAYVDLYIETNTWSVIKGDGSVPSPRDKLQGVALGPLIYYFGGFGPKSTGLDDDSDEEVCDCYCK